MTIYAALAALAALAPAAATAAPAPSELKVVLEHHQFTPSTLTIPADQKVTVQLVNHDGAADEFENEDLGVEKQIAPHGRATIAIGPLKPGSYRFVGELHPDTAVLNIRVEAQP